MHLRFVAASTLATSVLVIACGSSTAAEASAAVLGHPGADGATAASCTPVDAPRCGEGRHVATAEDFVREQEQLAWQTIASNRSGTLTASVDLIADEDLVIDATTLAREPSCASAEPAADAGPRRPKCAGVLFREDAFPRLNGTARVAGVDCAVPRFRVGRGESCEKLTIARGTTLRIRNVVLDDHPFGAFEGVEILPPCTLPCATGEARCDATQVCLPLGYETCAFCEGQPVRTCACRGACAALADGATCSYDGAPDMPRDGVCSAGTCTPSR